MAIIPSSPLLSRSSLSKRDGEKGCRDVQTVEGVRHFCVHTYIYIYFIVHILRLVLQAAQRTRIYAPLFTRTVERRDAEIHGIEVTHGCGEEEEEEDAGEEKNGCGQGIEMRVATRREGGQNVCAWRGRRGGTERLDFSDSEFCSSFFLPLLSLSLSHAHPLITDSPYLPSATRTTFSPAYHSFLRPRTLSTTSFPLPLFPPPPRNNVLSRSPSARLRLLRAV